MSSWDCISRSWISLPYFVPFTISTVTLGGWKICEAWFHLQQVQTDLLCVQIHLINVTVSVFSHTAHGGTLSVWILFTEKLVAVSLCLHVTHLLALLHDRKKNKWEICFLVFSFLLKLFMCDSCESNNVIFGKCTGDLVRLWWRDVMLSLPPYHFWKFHCCVLLLW